jgi:hypothetical protein
MRVLCTKECNPYTEPADIAPEPGEVFVDSVQFQRRSSFSSRRVFSAFFALRRYVTILGYLPSLAMSVCSRRPPRSHRNNIGSFSAFVERFALGAMQDSHSQLAILMEVKSLCSPALV